MKSKKEEFDKTACMFYTKGNCGIIVDIKKYMPSLGDKLPKKKCSPILPSCHDGVALGNLMTSLRK